MWQTTLSMQLLKIYTKIYKIVRNATCLDKILLELNEFYIYGVFWFFFSQTSIHIFFSIFITLKKYIHHSSCKTQSKYNLNVSQF